MGKQDPEDIGDHPGHEYHPQGLFEGGRCPVRRLSCGCAQVAATEGRMLSVLAVLIKA